jgi:hypothetical protein
MPRFAWLDGAGQQDDPYAVPGDGDHPGAPLVGAAIGQHAVPEQSPALEAAEARVRRAVADLARAEAALRGADEPLPGDRRQAERAHSAPAQVSTERLTQLERAVTEARREVAAASAARDALLP